MLSSSVGIEPELPPASARTPEPGWAADELRLVFPLLLSSSVLLPPVDNFDFRCPKLLVYRGGCPGLGEVDADSNTAGTGGEVLDGREPLGLTIVGGLTSAKEPRAEALPIEDGLEAAGKWSV